MVLIVLTLTSEHDPGVKVHLTVFYDFSQQRALEIQRVEMNRAKKFCQAVLSVMEMPVLIQFLSHQHAVCHYLLNCGDQNCSKKGVLYIRRCAVASSLRTNGDL